MGVAKIKPLKSKRRFWILVGCSILATIISLLGGFKLVIYLFLLLTGLFIGWQARRVWIVVQDYRLALKVNTVQFSAKQTETLKEKIKDLEHELKSANARINLAKGDAS